MPNRPPGQIKAVILVVVALAIGAMCSASLGAPPPSWNAPAVETPAENPTEAADGLAALKGAKVSKGITWRQRREMGLTFRNVLREMVARKRAGELDGQDSATLAASIMGDLVQDNPRAFAEYAAPDNAAIDPDKMERLMEFLKNLIELIMLFMAFV